MPTHAEHLDAVRRALDAVTRDIAALTQPLTPAQRLWRPAPAVWGVADCCEHLVAIGAAYHPRIRAALAGASRDPAHDARPWRPTWFGRWFLHMAGPEGRGTRIRARGPFVPPPARADAPERLLAQQGELAALIADARGTALRDLRVTSPLSRLLVLRVGEALEMLVVHQRRHLLQAADVVRASGFPARG